jgi:phosphodiesterase/alkaline phosphatase D-like protein
MKRRSFIQGLVAIFGAGVALDKISADPSESVPPPYPWEIGTYSTGDIVKDKEWTMVANVTENTHPPHPVAWEIPPDWVL